MSILRKTLTTAALIASLGTAGAAHADAVTHWNEIAVRAATIGRPGPPGLIDLAVVQAAVHDAVSRLRDEHSDPVLVVDAVFGAFSDGGAGHLISWLASTDNMDALEPLFATVTKAVRDLSKDAPNASKARSTLVRQNALALLSAALGNALIGPHLHSALGLPPGSLNKLSARELVNRAAVKRQ